MALPRRVAGHVAGPCRRSPQRQIGALPLRNPIDERASCGAPTQAPPPSLGFCFQSQAACPPARRRASAAAPSRRPRRCAARAGAPLSPPCVCLRQALPSATPCAPPLALAASSCTTAPRSVSWQVSAPAHAQTLSSGSLDLAAALNGPTPQHLSCCHRLPCADWKAGHKLNCSGPAGSPSPKPKTPPAVPRPLEWKPFEPLPCASAGPSNPRLARAQRLLLSPARLRAHASQ